MSSDQSSISEHSSSEPSPSQCRICLIDDPEQEVCFPCDCHGSMGAVHLDCLAEWIQACSSTNANWKKCEICGQDYRISYKPTPILKRHRPRFTTLETVKAILFFPLAIFATAYCLIIFPTTQVVRFRSIGNWTAHTVLNLLTNISFDLFLLSLTGELYISLYNLYLKWRSQNLTLVPDDDVFIFKNRRQIHPPLPPTPPPLTHPNIPNQPQNTDITDVEDPYNPPIPTIPAKGHKTNHDGLPPAPESSKTADKIVETDIDPLLTPQPLKTSIE
ncbi:hypothetical protein BLNAU_14845 [Blattamonas nauphoetae]|uniref:RING-CH-type domain-containing protein n=1 Tax=Blattamonas nauphoetae TaxID=2049346 RepID=A0ABQ9XJ17_9EUKA|nr:hypothetical protein BLNAU_14845 [Blattamonas nauphoetae]